MLLFPEGINIMRDQLNFFGNPSEATLGSSKSTITTLGEGEAAYSSRGLALFGREGEATI